MTQPTPSSQTLAVNPIAAPKSPTILTKMSVHLFRTYCVINQHFYDQIAIEEAKKRTIESTTEAVKRALSISESHSIPKGLSEYLVSEKDFLPIPRGFELKIKGSVYFAKQLIGHGVFGKVILFCQRDLPSSQLAVKMSSQQNASLISLKIERVVFEKLQRVTPPSLRELILKMEEFLTLETRYRESVLSTYFLAMELMSGENLRKVNLALSTATKSMPIHTLSNVRKIITRLAQTVQIFNLAKLSHCDLKPENIFTDAIDPSLVKVGDFGSSFAQEALKEYKHYDFVTRWYRAPEIFMQKYPYNKAIDVWSLGCLAFEVYTGQPLFAVKEFENEEFSSAAHLLIIMEVLGQPPKEMIDCRKAVLRHLYQEKDGEISLIPEIKITPYARSLPSLLKEAPPEFLDFVTRAVNWDPEKRMTIEEALEHPFIKNDLTLEKQPIA